MPGRLAGGRPGRYEGCGLEEAGVAISTAGAIDCDIHPAVPDFKALMPYLSDYWRESLATRGVDKLPLDLTMNPTGSPLMCRPDWKAEGALPGADFARLQADALDHFGTKYAICNVIHGALGLFQPYMAAAMCSAISLNPSRRVWARWPAARSIAAISSSLWRSLGSNRPPMWSFPGNGRQTLSTGKVPRLPSLEPWR